ncbi:MAG: T9SS type A sorting domain-containing protein [Chlorobi bacterium]|nr:T9SS type A sorting domain-containing protein [Chlorobiota bacterium]
MKQILFFLFVVVYTQTVFSQNNDLISQDKYISGLEKDYHKSLFSFEQSTVGNMYDLVYHRFNWEVNPAELYISGSVTSYFLAKQNNLSEVTFDLTDNLTVDSVLNNGNQLSFTHQNEVITVSLTNSLSLNQLDSLTIWYHGVPTQGGFGSFTRDFHNSTPIIWTLSEPYGAKDWWPCKQNLSDKIDSIDVFVTTPFPNKVASNGLLISETATGDNILYHWKHNHSIAAYLIAIAVTNYVTYSDYVPVSGEDSIEILNYVYPENLDYAKINTAQLIPVLQFFNEKFILYPFANEKYGHAQFGWGGGMEHQTMTFVGDFYLSLTTHELAHQWFGDYITCGSWEDIWLNEGFATYLTGMMYEQFFPETWLNYKQGQIDYITSQPDGSVFCDDTTSVNRIFDGRLSYVKGGMVLHMLRTELGDDNFFAALKNYLNDPLLANNYATTKDLQHHFETAADTNLNEFFNDWYYGEGYPNYSITWLQDEEKNMSLIVNQSQSDVSVDFFEMNLPFKFIGNNKDTTLIFHNTENAQEFVFSLNFEVVSVMFDPEYNLIKGTVNITNIPTPDKNDVFYVWPNPASDELYIKTYKPSSIEQVSIYNLSGAIINTYNFNSSNKKVILQLNNIKTGTYLVEIKSDENVVIKRIFIR